MLFSIMVYYRILNIVPCAILWDLVFYIYPVYNSLESANPKLLIYPSHPFPPSVPISFSTQRLVLFKLTTREPSWGGHCPRWGVLRKPWPESKSSGGLWSVWCDTWFSGIQFFFFFNQKPKGVYMCPIKRGLRSPTDQKGQIPQLTLDCINTWWSNQNTNQKVWRTKAELQ